LPLPRHGFVFQYPPFAYFTARGPFTLPTSPQDRPVAFYVHLPFCRDRCSFCFYRAGVSRAGDAVPDYLRRLEREADLYINHCLPLTQRPVVAVYFGGGTPTLLKGKELGRLTACLRSRFRIDSAAEITCEAEPGTVSARTLKGLRQLGVTRLSLGVQSLNDGVLRVNGRTHDARLAIRALALAKGAGFEVVNVDLMSGMLGDTMVSWSSTLEMVLSYAPENITIYPMELYANTRLYRDLISGRRAIGRDDRIEIECARFAYSRLAQAGYQPVATYSFARNPIFDHRHRVHIAEGGDLIGLGVSSYSYQDSVLYQNYPIMRSYADAVDTNQLPVYRWYFLRERERLISRIVLGLKQGYVDIPSLFASFGPDALAPFREVLSRLAERGLLSIESARIQLTTSGMIFADSVVRHFFLPEHATAVEAWHHG